MRNAILALICLGNLLIFNARTVAQSTLNYTKVWVAKKPIQNEADIISSSRTSQEVNRTTDYIDGFGRPVQTIVKRGSPLGQDVVNMHVYDALGMETKKYLPFVSSVQQSGDIANDGNYKPSAGAQQLAFNQVMYPGESNYYYTQMDYESSPISRATKVYSPGNSWVGSSRFTSVQNLVNTTADNVRIWTTLNNSQGIIPSGANAYDPGTLYKTVATDEKGVQQIEFKDRSGHTILTKSQQSATSDNGGGSGHVGWLCTYYVYDDYGNMRFVITPKAVGLIDGTWTISQIIADELCIRQEYDLQGRIVIKKNPGAQEQWNVYDKRGRMVMSQDGNQRTAQKWQYVQFDGLDRPTATGLIYDPSNFTNLTYHQLNAANSSSYPNVGSYSTELLSQTYYDNYAWVGGSGLNSSLDASNVSNTSIFYTPDNNTFPYPQAIAQTEMTRGLTTGAKIEVLGSNGSQNLYAVSFYDDKGRVVQTQSKNISGQIDKVTTQYSWTGSLLRSYLQHSKASPNPQSHNVLTKLAYDPGYRLLSVTKNITSTIGSDPAISSGDKIITSYTYDESGQLKTKSLGNSLESLTYDYNVRGWLLGVNRDFAMTPLDASHYFGFDLAYDKAAIYRSNGSAVLPGYNQPAYDGNLTGVLWKSKGDDVIRRYDYLYDKANRLINADYIQRPTWGNWSKTEIDYSVNNIAYDNNGNITALSQNGFAFGGNPNIDNLVYGYENNNISNRIQNVVDNANNAQSKLGDFHYSGSKSSSSIDYGYDADGNQVSDANKNISSISYNALNLPATVSVNGKGIITYMYDASGNKLRKTVQENGATVPYKGTSYTADITTITTYIDEFVYQSKSFTNTNPALAADLSQSEVLQVVGNEEGRTRLVSPSSGTSYHAFDYFIRDHLGNIRTTITDEQPAPDTYPAATIESGAIGTEQTFYDIKNDASHVISINSLPWYSSATNSNYSNNNGLPNPPDPTVNPTNANATLYKLNGATGDRYGMGIALKVMAGDVLNIYGKSVWHQNGTTDNTTYPLTAVITSLINSFGGTNTVFGGTHGAASGSILNGISSTTGPLSTWLTTGVPTPGGSTPKAYINWVFFDEQFKPLENGNGFDPVWNSSDYVKPHGITGISVPRSGYVYIYCSNESNQDVYFDNLQVVHFRGPILEEQHYYPQGLAMFAINSRAYGRLQTNFGYQGKEMQSGEFYDGSGLEEYDFGARYYDPQLSRWWAQDPAGQFATPYSAMNNNPTLNIDPDGRFVWAVVAVAAVIGGVSKGISAEMSGGNFWNGFWKGAIAGGVGGALATVGGGSFVGNVLWGAGEGVTTNGISNILDKKAFFAGAGSAALWGAGFAIATSDNMKNMFKGKGFRSHNQVLQKFVDGGDFQGSLDYFGMDAKFNPNSVNAAGESVRGGFSPSTNSIDLTANAFSQSAGSKASFDFLNSTYQKELWHKMRYIKNINFVEKYAEDAFGHAYQQKNVGAWPQANAIDPLRHKKGFANFIGRSSDYFRTNLYPSYHTLIYKPGFKEFLYSIPRRFRNMLNYQP